MSEIRKEAKTYIVQYACDDCEKIPNPGCILEKQSTVMLTYPDIYYYKCPNCKKEYKFSQDYPVFQHEL